IPAKIIIARPSPGLGAVGPGGWGAFPSGHTTTGSACYVLAALLIAGSVVTRRRVALAGSMMLSFLIGLALVWRDFHWFTDVLAGWALAALIVQAALGLAGRKGPGRAGRAEPTRVPDAQESVAPG
ncbi:MAG: phosphatase PAP2 family protein, partial [Actinomycetota bacterium]